MKSSWAEVRERRDRLAAVLVQEGYLSVAELAARFTVSEATVRRDLSALEKDKRITRTHGGALSEFDALFVPFQQRNMQNREAKQRIARSALQLLQDGQVLFLDAGSTVFAVAEAIVESSLALQVVTNSLPVAEVLTSSPTVETHLLGGCLLPHQLIVVGSGVTLSLSAWHFDLSLFSAEGMSEQGLWNSQDDITGFQRHVHGRSETCAFCLDVSKLGRVAPSFLLPWSLIDRVVSDALPDQITSLGQEAMGVEWLAA
ncbi:MAG: DeoR/GlpR family DNA-binding transcription regulator [Acidobacteriota bacterium]|jgi:DeoR/GlpR family transcriptional regulator of sugar metabolism